MNNFRNSISRKTGKKKRVEENEDFPETAAVLKVGEERKVLRSFEKSFESGETIFRNRSV